MPLAPLNIGPVSLATNLLIAPLAGYTDLAYRLVARACGGVGLGCTELICPDAVLRETPRTLDFAATCPKDSPLAVQLFGADVNKLCEAARWAEDRGAHILDINMGCPVDRVTKQNGGSKLLCDPDNTLRIVERIVKTLRHIPLTAKLRLGWDDAHIVAPQLAARLENAGVALIAIHGRTTEMQFSGQCRLDGIAQVVAAVKRIPVIGNGDIRSPQDADHMIKTTGCAGVMIGRKAIAMPWIFRDTWSYLTTGTIPPPPTIDQICQMMRDHFYNIIRFRNERVALIEFRHRISWYAKQLHPCRALRDQMRLINSPADFERALTTFLDWRHYRDQQIQKGHLPPNPDPAPPALCPSLPHP